jgi:PhnB protein
MKDVSIIPEVTVHDARGAIEFYKKAFGAKDLGTHATPDGKKVMHSALELNGGVVFVCDDFPERNGARERSPRALGGSPVTIHLNCQDVDKVWKAALKARASVVLPLERQFWGDIYGIVEDPFGQRWSMSAAQVSAKPDVQSSEYKKGADRLYPTAKAKARPAAKAKSKGSARSKTGAKAKSKAKRR